MKREFDLPIPYPDGRPSEQNRARAALLEPLYAGRNGEMTSVAQYCYQYLITFETYPELAEMLEAIAVCDMRHMEMLGEIIASLGGDPLLRAADHRMRFLWWSGDMVRQTKDIKRFLTEDREEKKGAVAEINRRLRAIGDEYIRSVLSRIILDEEHHVELLDDALDLVESYGL